jgi:hypothetical protein
VRQADESGRQVLRRVRRQDGLALCLLLAVGCATMASTKQPPPERLLVHIDTLAPDKLQQFADARRRWVAELRRRGLSDRRGDYLQIGERTFYSVERLGPWRDLDRLGGERRRVMRKMGALGTEYDRVSDEALVFPHASEIWVEQPELGYLPSGRPLTEALQLVIEDVDPNAYADYEAAWRPIAAALAAAHYPVERRTYFAAYGSGRICSFWLAPSRTVIATAPPIEQLLATQLGTTRAAELMRAWRAALLHVQTLDVAVDPALSSP